MVELQASATKTITELAVQLKVDSIRATTEAGSGHPTSSMSAADLMAVLMVKYLRYDFDKPQNPANDRLIFSKGHAAPLLYSMYRAAGCVGYKKERLLSLRQFGSRLEGHPVPKVIPWVDVATGSLGQGLAMGVGMAIAAKYLDRLDYRVWVLLGDSEMAEGSVWEAMASASHYQLNNLIAILDMNRLGQRGETALGWDSAAYQYARPGRAFGFHVIEVNGHDLADQIDFAYQEAMGVLGQPILIIAKTEKGHGLALTANQDGWHGKPLTKDQAKEAIKTLGGVSALTVAVQKPWEQEKKSVISPEGEEAREQIYDTGLQRRSGHSRGLRRRVEGSRHCL